MFQEILSCCVDFVLNIPYMMTLTTEKLQLTEDSVLPRKLFKNPRNSGHQRSKIKTEYSHSHSSKLIVNCSYIQE